ncbi:MAG: nucleotidyltransferase domain-containing protein [Patescibacteria group bacterium]
MELNLLEKSILATIAYYDTMDYPLTGFEVFKYLINPKHIASFSKLNLNSEVEPMKSINLIDILKILSNQNLKQYIDQKNGFYSLKGRDLYQTRIERQKISDRMWQRSRKIIKWLQIIPNIKLILMNGSVAIYNAKKESDIDLLIVAKNKRIWLTRFLVTIFFQIIGQRRHGNKIANKFCLNHYTVDNNLKMNSVSLCIAHLCAHLVPILELEQGIYNRFQFENRWVGNYLYFYNLEKLNNRQKIKDNKILKFVRKFQEIILNTFIGTIFEKTLRFFQIRHIKRHPLLNQKGGQIVFNDMQLEFHPDSPEGGLIERYNKNMTLLNFGIQEQDSGLKK